MPPDPHNHHHQSIQLPSPKPNQRVLSLILKALIMTFITSLFFLFLGVAAILLLFLAGGALHRRRRVASSGEARTPNSSQGFSPRDLRKLPQFRCTREIESECVVCLDAVREGQWCRRLVACNHVFHRRCLDTWLIKVPACPICRTRVRLDLGETASSSSVNVDEEAKQWWGFDGGQRI